jgi:hypothetical protein
MALTKFRAAPLPNAPPEYDPHYIRQLIRVLETYFSQLDSLTPNQAESYRADNFYGGAFTGTDITANNITTTTLETNDFVATNAYIQRLDSEFAHIHALASEQVDSPVFAGDHFYGGTFYGDGRFLQLPYNQLMSDQDQTAASVANAYAITLNINEFPNGISVVSNSRITFAKEGIYNVSYSIQLKNTDNSAHDVDIWLRKNGTDIPSSNSRFSLPARKSSGDPSHLIAVTPVMVDITADNQYVEIMWRVSSTTVSIEHFPAVAASPGVTPAIPATPSAIVGITHVSAQFPPVTRVAPLPVIGFGQIGNVSVSTR